MTPDRLPLSSGVRWAALGSRPWPYSESTRTTRPGRLRKRLWVLFAGGCVRSVIADGWLNRPETTGAANTAVRHGPSDFLLAGRPAVGLAGAVDGRHRRRRGRPTPEF